MRFLKLKQNLLFGAMVFGGLSGYLILWLVLNTYGAEAYAGFAAFWSALYLIVGALSGIQQEFTRGTVDVVNTTQRAKLHKPVLAVAGIVGLTVFMMLFLLLGIGSNAIIPSASVLPLLIGGTGYSIIAALTGGLYGLKAWPMLATMVFGDSVLRILFLSFAVLNNFSTEMLFLAVALPFPVMLFILGYWIVRKLDTFAVMDSPTRVILWNSTRTVLASVAMAVLLSGLPLVIAGAEKSLNPEELGQFLFAVTISRAPLAVILISLQSYLLVRLRDATQGKKFARSSLISAFILGTVLWLGGYSLGVPVLEIMSGGEITLTPWTIAMLLSTSVLLGGLILSGISALASNNHFSYAFGWVLAAGLTIIFLVAVQDFALKLWLSFGLAPISGIAIHLFVKRKN